MSLNRRALFDAVRTPVFSGALTQSQVDGVSRILDYAEASYPDMRDTALAYLLATVTWETGHAMQPVREGGGEAYLKSKPYYPWVGEGLVQVTWRANAEKFGATKPGDCMSWPVALRACFEGMSKGVFTGRKLDDYFTEAKCDFVNARRIINGTDHAADIAAIAKCWLKALEAAGSSVAAPVIAAAAVKATAPSTITSAPKPGLWSRVGKALASGFFVAPTSPRKS